jgi:hypothetical protein
MADTTSTDNMFAYMYLFDIEFKSPKDSSISVVPLRVNYAIKSNDYMHNFLPTLKMEMIIKKKDLFILRDNKEKLLANITQTAKKYSYSDSDRNNAAGEKNYTLIETKIVMNEVFEPLFDKKIFTTQFRENELNDTRKSDDEDETKGSINSETGTYTIAVSFFNIKAILMNKTLFNIVFSGCTPGTALGYIIDQCAATKVIVDPPVNEHEYENLILPPYNLRATLENLQSRYGIYENGLLVYYDFDTLYILDKFATTHEVETSDSTISTIKIHEPDIDPHPTTDITTNSDNSLTYEAAISLETYDRTVASGEIEGNSIMFTNYKIGLAAVDYKNGAVDTTKVNQGSVVLKRNITTHESSGEKVVLDYDELNNPYNMATLFNTIESTQNMYMFNLNGVCVDSFKPNKYIELAFINTEKNNKYGGIYNLIHNTLQFIPPSYATKELICNARVAISSK